MKGVFSMSKKRYDPNRKRVKERLFQQYGYVCFVCEKKFTRQDLQIHHIKKFEHTHTTTFEDSGLTCDCCHKLIHHEELYNKKEYNQLNDKIRNYKATHYISE
jgi:predicted HNH restriction endonuclease